MRPAAPLLLLLVLLLGCPEPPPDDDDDVTGSDDDDVAPDDDDSAADDDDSGGDDDDSGDDDDATPPPPELRIKFLGVGGVAMEVGDDLLLTAPLYSNPDLTAVTLGEVTSDVELVDALLDDGDVAGAAAILVGHGHYDHLLDVPRVAELAGSDPVVYGNLSVANLVGADLVQPLNDPAAPLLDMRSCPEPDPCTGVPADFAGEWVDVPGARARVRAFCSTHPAQFLGIIHFGEGCVAEPHDAPPVAADQWLEGTTLSFLVDFLDTDGAPIWRVYYQDAPTDPPFGHPPDDVLDDGKAVDVAVLNVGNWDAVEDHPGAIVATLDPRYLLGIHWESFFASQEPPVDPIPFHADPAGFDAGAGAALPVDDEPPVLVDGYAMEGRWWRPWPQTEFHFTAEGAYAPPELVPDASTEYAGDAIAFGANVPAAVADCPLVPDAPCDDADGDGLVDAWEDLLLDRLRPLVRFDESEPLLGDVDAVLHDVGRVFVAADGSVHAYVMIGYSEDYGRCGATFHDGDSERVAIRLALLPDEGPGDAIVTGLYTAAHEGTITDHGTVLVDDDLTTAVFEDDALSGEPRWVVFASDGKHATYPTIDACENAEWAPCLDEDCAPDNVDDPAAFDVLPPIVNAGEEDAPRWTDLNAIGFPGEDAWADQPFCGGRGAGPLCSSAVREKLLVDPFD